ncbi:MAG: hypothetical protein HDQ87_10405 [Clostridia bacterium]|nr:hypothetical protein [Clostridia bacterium]
MRRTIPALLMAAVFLLLAAAGAGAAAAPADRVGVILYLMNAENEPLANTTVLLQENINSQDAYEGETDRQGIMMIPSFPLTGFVMAVRNEDNALAGLIDMTMYPGSSTEIMNNPRTDHDTVSLETLRGSTLSEHINGNAPLEIAGGGDSIPLLHYEVQVSEAAGGVGALFKVEDGNTMVLEGVSDGAPGAVIPEPTLPPDDDAALPASRPPASPSAAVTTPAPSETEQPSAAPTTAAPETPSPVPSQTEPQPSPSAVPSETEQPTQEPSAVPSTEPTPTPVPPTDTPSPTSVPTTQASLVNVKLQLKNTAGTPLAYYRTQLNGTVDATANGEGEAYYTNVTTNVTHELTVSTPEGSPLGSCGLRFIEGQSTSVASVSTGSTYTIDYQAGTQDVYVEMVVDAGDVAAGQASAEPAPDPTPVPSDAAAAPASAAEAQPQASEDVIGTPSTPETVPASGPSLTGYFSDEAGVAIGGATIRLRNEDTKALSSAITTAEGTFTISQLPPGNYSIGALSPQGRNLGEIQFTAARGTKTRLKTSSNGTTYLSEAQDADTVYVDLRELSNGSLDMLYAAQSPMAAPAMPTTRVVEPAAVKPPVLDMEQTDETVVVEPEDQGGSLGMIILVAGLCAAGAAAAVILISRNARIR